MKGYIGIAIMAASAIYLIVAANLFDEPEHHAVCKQAPVQGRYLTCEGTSK